MADIDPKDLKLEFYDARRQPMGQTVPQPDPRPFKLRLTYLPQSLYVIVESGYSFLEAKNEALKQLHTILDRQKRSLMDLPWSEYDGS